MQIPTFNSEPLSAILPLPKDEHVTGQHWLYINFWEHQQRVHSLEAISDLVADGWVKSPASVGAAGLESQLYDTVRLMYPDQQKGESWYKPEPDEISPAPVTLAFSIPRWPALQNLPMLNPYPLPQLGEYGYVLDARQPEQALTSYYIMELPLVARQRWIALGEKLKELSSPLHWPPFTREHQIVSDETEYQRHMNAIRTQLQIATGEQQRVLFSAGTHLEAAHVHITQLRNALKKESTTQQWQEVQTMARNLARDYDDYHQSIVNKHEDLTNASVPDVSDTADSYSLFPSELMNKLAVEQPSKQKKPKVARPRKEPTPIVAKGKESISHNSNQFNWEIINALRDKSTYKHYPKYNIAEHKHTFMHEKGQLLITISAQEGEGWETVLNALNTLGDGCIDTYIAVMAIAIEQNGTDGDRLRIPITINPDDILAICGKEKSHGSYTPFQRAEIIKHLKTLSQSKIIVTMPGRPATKKKRGGTKNDGTILRAEGQLIDLLSFKIGEYHTITGEEVWERRAISVGPWATMIPGLNITTAMMFRSLLAYSAKNQRYQKRIGLYLTQMFRINAKRGGQFKDGITMKQLLEGSGIVVPREQGAFRDAIEKAIQQLKDEGIIGNFWQVVDSDTAHEETTSEIAIRQHARGWFAYYLQQIWNFSPSESVKQQYKDLLKAPDKQE